MTVEYPRLHHPFLFVEHLKGRSTLAAAPDEAIVAEEVEEVVVLLLAAAVLDLGVRWVVTPAGFVLRRTFFVLGSLLSFLYFIRRFWNQILICLSDRHSACAISILLRRVR